jgi:hypothetical protein
LTFQPARQFVHRLAPEEHFKHVEQHKLHGRHQHALHSRQVQLLYHCHHPHLLYEHKKLIQQSRLAQFVHLFDLCSGVQCLPYSRIISVRQLPA